MKRYWRITTIGTVAVAALLLAAAPAVPGAPLAAVKVVFRPIQTWGPLFIAEKEGFFARQGLKIEWVPQSGGGQAIVPLISGDIQVGPEAASAAFFNAVARGEMVRIVADKGYVAPGSKVFSSLLVRKDLFGTAIKTVADLKGRRVAVNAFGSTSHYIFTRMLASASLRPTDVNLERMPNEAMVVGLVNKALDAVMIPEPFITELQTRDIASLMAASGDYAPNEQIAFIFYGPDFLRRNRESGQRFMVGYLQGLRQYAKGPTPRNVAIVAEYTKVEPDVIRRGGWMAMFPDGHLEVNRLRRFQDWLYEVNFISVRNPVSTLVDESFLEYANGVLGR